MKNFTILLCMLVVGCQSNDSNKGEGDQESKLLDERPSLICQVVRSAEEYPDAPISEVYFILGEMKRKVGETPVCQPIDRSEYANYDIPDIALSAVGSWYAGGGDYYYLIAEMNTYKVLHAAVDEMQEGPAYQYELVLNADRTGKVIE